MTQNLSITFIDRLFDLKLHFLHSAAPSLHLFQLQRRAANHDNLKYWIKLHHDQNVVVHVVKRVVRPRNQANAISMARLADVDGLRLLDHSFPFEQIPRMS